ncbi:transposase [Nonomuraea sp. NPDC052116]|uniref:transposase n=1 Tax=Nonomuraea sp. NPDC052116 TaxID=3155665 RepID=UPI003424843A
MQVVRLSSFAAQDQHRYASAKARKNYAGTSPITRASGKKKAVLARYVHNDRLIDALIAQAATAIIDSAGLVSVTYVGTDGTVGWRGGRAGAGWCRYPRSLLGARDRRTQTRSGARWLVRVPSAEVR